MATRLRVASVSKSPNPYSLKPLLSNRLPYPIVDNWQRRHSEDVDRSGILLLQSLSSDFALLAFVSQDREWLQKIALPMADDG